MGRHSAPDDEDAGVDDRTSDAPSSSSVATAVAPGPPGRHAREDMPRPRPTPAPASEPALDEPPTDGLAFLEQAFDVVGTDDATTVIPLAEIARNDRPVPEEVTTTIAPVTDVPAAPPQPAPTPVRPDRVAGAHATKHDLALVMSHRDVRARALAAILVPFVGYVVVLAIVGALTVHSLVWLWVPAIVAGVLVGVVLDAGHRRYPAPPSDAVSESAARSS